MKHIKIRFIEKYSKIGELEYYTAQIKRWYGWRHMGIVRVGQFGSYFYIYCEGSKDELLKRVYDHFSTTKKHLDITEYPELKAY